MRRFEPGYSGDIAGWMKGHVSPEDWAAQTRMHEGAHAALSEALGIPIEYVQADPSMDPTTGSRYRNGPGPVDLQAAVYLVGAPAGAQELRDRGYDDEDLLYNTETIGGHLDRGKVWDMIDQGLPVDGDAIQRKVWDIVRQPDFKDAAHNVAQALADRGDRLTHADVVAALGSYRERNGLLTPAMNLALPPEPAPPGRTAEVLDGANQVTVHGPKVAEWPPQQRDVTEPEPPAPGYEDDFDIDL